MKSPACSTSSPTQSASMSEKAEFYRPISGQRRGRCYGRKAAFSAGSKLRPRNVRRSSMLPDALQALLDAIDKVQLDDADAAAWKRWVEALVAGDAEQEQPASNNTEFTQQK